MAKSVKIKDLLSPNEFHRVSGDESSMEREVYVADINRPGFELAGFFKHSDFRRIILLGEKENAFIEEMTKTESAPTGLTVFYVTDSGNGGYIQTRTISHIFENHRTNISFISILEEL